MSVSKAENYTKSKPRWAYYKRLKDRNGITVILKKSGYKTQREAENAEQNAIEQFEINQNTIKTISMNILVNHFLNIKKNEVELSSYGTIENKIKKHIQSDFNKINDISALSANDVKNWHESLKKKGLSINYIRTLNSLLSEMLNHAIVYFDLQRNIASLIKVKDTVKDRIPKEKEYYTLDEFKQFRNGYFEEYPNKQYNLICEMMFWLGMRKAEIKGLRLDKIDLENGVIHIHRNVVRSRSKEMTKELGLSYIEKSVKSKSSYRDAVLPKHIAQLIKEQIEYIKVFYGFSENCYLFGITEPIVDMTLSRAINDIAEKAGVKKITPHGLRHSYATLINTQTKNIYLASKMLGHSDIDTTTIYLHSSLEEKQEFTNQLDELNRKIATNLQRIVN